MQFRDVNGAFQHDAASSRRASSPRICMPTWRNFAKDAYRCGLYEAQDVLSDIDDVHLINLDMTWAAWLDEYWLRTPLYHDPFSKLIFKNPGLRKIRLTKEYDVFIAVCATFWDLPYINAIEQWRDHCKIGVCWLDELWMSDIPNYKYWLPALKQFDYVFVGTKGTVSSLSQAANRPCFWLPGGVDTLRFSPFSYPTARTVDVYSIGRRYEGIHQEMLKAAARGEIFYVHDTHGNGGLTKVYDYRQHRQLFANIAKRSRFFTVGAAKMNQSDYTKGQVEIGYRYYEGAAAGTVMVGDAPKSDSYRELFGWPDAVIEIQPDGSDVMAVLGELGSEPERMAAISRRNAREALLRHDWSYRWSEMFRIAGIEPSPRTATREQRLSDLADLSSRADQPLNSLAHTGFKLQQRPGRLMINTVGPHRDISDFG
jgi:spore maturation protein CgeB